MPGRNGYEVAEYIKTTPGLAHIPVLLLTGAFEPIDQLRADKIGCDGILAKPFEPQLVIARVKELLNRSAPPASPPEAVEAAAGSEQEAPPPRADSLADAFAALLAAERSLGSPLRPVEPRAQSPVSDEVIEDVARRVINRMSDRVVRETVRQLALETTERLVREEIDRIKSSVR
jgi:CheY-like chemotaxis protein